MFLGPGVYEDHEKYKSLTKAPCAAVYRKSVYTKESGGKEGYVMIGNNMIMYEPAFDKSR